MEGKKLQGNDRRFWDGFRNVIKLYLLISCKAIFFNYEADALQK